MSLSAILLLAVLSVTAYAADPIEADTSSCPVKGVEGPYSYDPFAADGPEKWGTLPGFETCGTGSIQSPIDFPTTVRYAPRADGPMPRIGVGNMSFSVGSYNWALSCVEGSSCGTTEFGGKTFNLINIHFHAPSEHTLNGTQFPLESHMVHQSDDGSLAVIATMYQFPDEESYPSAVYAGAPVEFGKSSLVKQILGAINKGKEIFPVRLGSIINAKLGYCTYVGSLTTPPCSEGVTFLMAMHIETVSKRQVGEYRLSARATIDGNARPVQPLNDREVTCYIL